jgi:hypothetical protein
MHFDAHKRPALFGLALILVAALAALAPELAQGPSCGHDFDFHLVSWFDALNAWRHGILYPHWAASANYGAGEPRFVFYSPLTWMLGAALGAVLPWTLVPLALTYILLAGTGLAVRSLARQALTEGAATLAGCCAIFSGYALFTAYERTAFAELAGGLWIPLVLLGALSCERTAGPFWTRMLRPATLGLALAVAGAWLSNPTVGVMACYTLAFVALVRTLSLRSWIPALRAAVGVVLGIGLIAAYLVPAALEQRWVDIHQVTEDPGQTLENNWLFARHADPALALHDAVLHTVSLIAVAMVALALLALLVCRLRRRLPGERAWWLPLALLVPVVLLLHFSISAPLWRLPELRFLQFPWRWLLVLESPLAILFAAALWSPRRRVRIAVVAASLAIFAGMLLCTTHVFEQACDFEDSVPGMLAVARSGQGFIGTNEYEPLGADLATVSTGLPAACLVADPRATLGKAVSTDPDVNPAWQKEACLATFSSVSRNPEHRRIVGTAPRAGFAVLRLLSFPAWRLRLNGQPVASLAAREDGLIVIPVSAGPITLTADWATTGDVLLARILSGFFALLFAALALLVRRVKGLRTSTASIGSRLG